MTKKELDMDGSFLQKLDLIDWCTMDKVWWDVSGNNAGVKFLTKETLKAAKNCISDGIIHSYVETSGGNQLKMAFDLYWGQEDQWAMIGAYWYWEGEPSEDYKPTERDVKVGEQFRVIFVSYTDWIGL